MGPILSFTLKTDSKRVKSSTMNFQKEAFCLSLGSENYYLMLSDFCNMAQMLAIFEKESSQNRES